MGRGTFARTWQADQWGAGEAGYRAPEDQQTWL